MYTVKQWWEKYREQCVSKDAGHVQVQETKKAFYAGFSGMLSIFGSDEDKTEDEMIAILDSIQKELMDYAKLHKAKAEVGTKH